LTEHINTRFPQFYLTVPTRCPYLSDQFERKVFTQLHGRLAVPLNDALTHAGFRRSQNIAYKPACEDCCACLSVRIPVNAFRWTKSFKRIANKNSRLVSATVPAIATEEQFGLLKDYLDTRHGDGGMASMTILDYAAMVEESAVDTHLVEYREPSARPNRGKLVAVALTDVLADGLSMVYSFFATDRARNSLGSYIILDHIRQAADMGLGYLYLGYWVKGSKKMAYKSRFKPLEFLGSKGWEALDPELDAAWGPDPGSDDQISG